MEHRGSQREKSQKKQSVGVYFELTKTHSFRLFFLAISPTGLSVEQDMPLKSRSPNGGIKCVTASLIYNSSIRIDETTLGKN